MDVPRTPDAYEERVTQPHTGAPVPMANDSFQTPVKPRPTSMILSLPADNFDRQVGRSTDGVWCGRQRESSFIADSDVSSGGLRADVSVPEMTIGTFARMTSKRLRTGRRPVAA